MLPFLPGKIGERVQDSRSPAECAEQRGLIHSTVVLQEDPLASQSAVLSFWISSSGRYTPRYAHGSNRQEIGRQSGDLRRAILFIQS